MVPRTDRGRRVQQRIYADRPQCVAVVGDPRIGKTLFLEWLAGSARAGDPAPPPGTRFASLALRDDAPSASPDAFLRAVLAALPPPPGDDPARGPAPPDGADASARTYAAFETAVERIAAEDGRLVLLLDDFDHVTGSERFPVPFFSFLRSIANNFPVAYVTTSRLDLQRLCALKEVEESPFFNIFQNVNLGPLDDGLIRQIVAERAPGEGEAGALADWAAAQAGGLPAAAAACVDACAAGAQPGTPEAERALDAAAEPYLAELWAHLDEPHRALLARVAGGEAPGERDAKPLRDLGPRRGYLVERDGRWAIASPALERYVRGRAAAGSAGLLTRVRRLFGGGG